MKTARTTITLETDLAEKLKREMRRTGASFKQTVNTVLRRGLSATVGNSAQEPFKVRPFDPRPRPGISYDKVWDLIDRLDGPFWR